MLVFACSDPLRKQFTGQRPVIGLPSLKPSEERLGDRVRIGVVDKGGYCCLIALECIVHDFSIIKRSWIEIGRQPVAHGLAGKVLRETMVDEPLAARRMDKQPRRVKEACDQRFPVRYRNPGTAALPLDPAKCALAEIDFSADSGLG